MPLHPSHQRPDPHARLARQRRRLWMIVFSTFMLASVLSLIYVATGLRRQTPAPDLAALAQSLQPQATWTLRLAPFPEFLGQLVAKPQGSDDQGVERLIRRIENNTHPVAQVYLLNAADDEEAAERWAVVVALKRSQRLYAEPLRRALEQARDALGNGGAVIGAAEGRLVLASSTDVLALVEAAWPQAIVAEDAPLDQMAPLAYEGPASRTTPHLRQQLARLIDGWPADPAALEGLSLAIVWQDAPRADDAVAEILVAGSLEATRALARAGNLAVPDDPAGAATLRWSARGLRPLASPIPETTDTEGEGEPQDVLDLVEGPEWVP